MATNNLRKKKQLQRVGGPVFGRKRANSRIYKIGGSWTYRPTMFYSSSIFNAYATAENIDSDLSVWDEAKKEWLPIIETDLVYTIGEEWDEDANMDLSTHLLDENLQDAGFDLTYKKLCRRKGRIIESAYKDWRPEYIPKGAYELVPGMFI